MTQVKGPLSELGSFQSELELGPRVAEYVYIYNPRTSWVKFDSLNTHDSRKTCFELTLPSAPLPFQCQQSLPQVQRFSHIVVLQPAVACKNQ